MAGAGAVVPWAAGLQQQIVAPAGAVACCPRRCPTDRSARRRAPRLLPSHMYEGMLSALNSVRCPCGCRGERARAVTTVFGGLDVGSAVGLLLCGPLIHWFGWQSVFYLFALLGLVWCAAWPLFKPEEQDASELAAGWAV